MDMEFLFGMTAVHMRVILLGIKWKEQVKQKAIQSHNNSNLGKYTWKDGRIYLGEWKENRMHGKGRFSWPDGHSYEGEYAEDKKHGKGRFSWPDRRFVEGEWKNGKRIGMGLSEIFNTHDEYSSNWQLTLNQQVAV